MWKYCFVPSELDFDSVHDVHNRLTPLLKESAEQACQIITYLEWISFEIKESLPSRTSVLGVGLLRAPQTLCSKWCSLYTQKSPDNWIFFICSTVISSKFYSSYFKHTSSCELKFSRSWKLLNFWHLFSQISGNNFSMTLSTIVVLFFKFKKMQLVHPVY